MNEKESEVLKSKIPVCDILGVNIAAINMNWLIKFTEKYVHDLSGEYICVSNVHTTITAYDNSKYRTIQNNSIMAIPDGGPLSSVGKKRGFKHMERVTGPSYMETILRISAKRGYKHYFYGSTPESLTKMCNNLREKFPGLQIVGTYSPPFRDLSDDEDSAIISEINEIEPDFIWVGLGAPKQEIWMSKHKGKVHGLMVGVGAGFDYLAGNIKRAPLWMQKANLEWLYRLIQDPKHLFRRYLYTNLKFIWLVYFKSYNQF